MKLTSSGQYLLAHDLFSLSNYGLLTNDLLKFYTYRQIEKFGLQNEVCYFTFDSFKLISDAAGSKGDFLDQFAKGGVNSTEINLPNMKYCICVYNNNNGHFGSLVSLKLFVTFCFETRS